MLDNPSNDSDLNAQTQHGLSRSEHQVSPAYAGKSETAPPGGERLLERINRSLKHVKHGKGARKSPRLCNDLYPRLPSLSDRLEWAIKQSVSPEPVAPAESEQATSFLCTPISPVLISGIEQNVDVANRFAQAYGVHAAWLQGGDVNRARNTLPDEATPKETSRYVTALVRAHYPLDELLVRHRSSPFVQRVIFAIVRYELATLLRFDLTRLARLTGPNGLRAPNLDTLRAVVTAGHAQVRVAFRLAESLGVNAVWLYSGTGMVKGSENPRECCSNLALGISCQGDRLDIAKLRLSDKGCAFDDWSWAMSELGIPGSTLSAYRHCGRKLSGKHASLLATYLNVDVSWLKGPVTLTAINCTCTQGSMDLRPKTVVSHLDKSTVVGRIAYAKQALDEAEGRTVPWKELGSRAGVTGAWFSLYAQGRRKLTRQSCQTAASALNVDAHWLWTGDDICEASAAAHINREADAANGAKAPERILPSNGDIINRVIWALDTATDHEVTSAQPQNPLSAFMPESRLDDRVFAAQLLLEKKLAREVPLKEIAENSGISVEHLYLVKRGRRTLSAKRAPGLAKALDVSPSWLLGVDATTPKWVQYSFGGNSRCQDWSHFRALLRPDSGLHEKIFAAKSILEQKLAREVSLTEIAVRSAMSLPHLRCFSNGRTELSTELAIRLASALDVSPGWLLGFNAAQTAQDQLGSGSHKDDDDWSHFNELLKPESRVIDKFFAARLILEQMQARQILWKEIAEECEISVGYLSSIRAGLQMPQGDLAARIAAALNVETDWLFAGKR